MIDRLFVVMQVGVSVMPVQVADFEVVYPVPAVGDGRGVDSVVVPCGFYQLEAVRNGE